MQNIGIGLGIRPAFVPAVEKGDRSLLSAVPVMLDMGCRSVVNCVQFVRGGGRAIPALFIERGLEALGHCLTNAFGANSMVLYQREYWGAFTNGIHLAWW
jgi:hypothetical protein